MNKYFISTVILSLGLVFACVGDANAGRLGGGSSFGRMPSAPVQKQFQPAPPVQRPQQPQQATPSPQNAQPANRFGFGGMLGGLAAGLGIGYLLSLFGLGEDASSLVLGLLIAFAAGFIILSILRRLSNGLTVGGQSSAVPTNVGMQKSFVNESGIRQEPVFNPAANAYGRLASDSEPYALNLPDGFDEYVFLDNAKQYFVKLQKAWDVGDLSFLREYTTPQMFIRLQQDLGGRSDGANQTDVVTLNAKLLGIETVNESYLCSVQFSGMIREQLNAPASSFSEIWNLSKPVEGAGGWVLAGIQQMV